MGALDDLRNVTTGTITTLLLKRGIRHSWMQGPMPLNFKGKRVVGPAFTLRFVPVREDLATPESWGKPISTRAAIEDMPEGCIAIADAMGVTAVETADDAGGLGWLGTWTLTPVVIAGTWHRAHPMSRNADSPASTHLDQVSPPAPTVL